MNFKTTAIFFIFALSGGVTFGQVTTRISVDSSGTESNGHTGDAAISADGRYEAFYSDATNLVPGDTNLMRDVFVRDRLTGLTTRVSVDSNGVEGNAASSGPAISADGRYVAFYSDATNLVPGDTNLFRDVFVHDRQTGITTRVSVDANGVQGDKLSSGPQLSADGRYVVFYSDSTNLVPGDTNLVRDVFVYDRNTGIPTRMSVDSNGVEGNARSSEPAISADGRFVAFFSDSTNLVGNDTNLFRDVFVHDRQTGITTRVSVDSSGAEANEISSGPDISGDGRYVTFYSDASNLVPGDTNLVRDVFVHDRQTATTTRVSMDSSGVQGNAHSAGPFISDDGRYVAFYSDSTNLVPGDTNLVRDAFLRDRQTGITTRLSVDSNGVQGNALSSGPQISANGRYVAFYSDATNLVSGDTNLVRDSFLRGPELTLDIQPVIVSAGQKITFTIYEGKPGNIASLWAVKVKGSPIFTLIFASTFGSNGNFALSGTVPPGLAGLNITFTGFAIGQAGFVLRTNDTTVFFQ
jgi:Tol biopolymer transport system component